jgi:hypothetical protein
MFMKRVFAAVALILLAVVVAAAQDGGGWVKVFNGKNLDGWTPVGKADWKVMNGELWSTNGNGFLVSKQAYGDFEIRAEFWVSPDANSGIFIRCDDPAKVGAMTCYEVNIYDTRPDPAFRTGGIVDVAKPNDMTINTGNKWNTYEITARGPRMTIRLNGKVTADAMDNKHPRGPFALQAGIGTVRFRNVQIRALK